jgi:hypothetical protein
MSLADDAKLLLIPTGYKTSKVYSVFPTDGDGDFTYTRSGDASRVNPGGLIETVGTNIPRIDHTGGGCPTLLLEPQRTNYAIRNTSLHLNSTLSNSGTITKTGNYAIAPDGTMTATRLQASATGSGYALLNVNGVNPSIDGDGGGYYISTIYVKSNTGQEQICAFYGASSGSPKTRTITNEWTRIQFTGYRPSNGKYTYIGVAINNGSDDQLDFLVWGGQTELVNSYASSLIITPSTSIVTRQKDQCLNGGDANLFDITEGTFFVDANNFGTPLNAYSMITISDGTGSNYIRYIYESSRIRVSVLGLGDYFITGVNDNERNKVAITFKENEMKVFFNGSLVHTDTLGVLPNNIDRLNFASQSGTSRHFEGKIHDVRVYDRILTEAEAIELTTL